MGKLIITGDDNQLQTIAKRSRLAAAKYGLKITLNTSKKAEDKTSANDGKPKPKKKGWFQKK